MGSHSSVNYVEPNLAIASDNGIVNWKAQDDYERSPRLEDYCITVNLEVEVCSRNNISANNKITSEVLILSYKSNMKDDTSVINFMGGTKISCNNRQNTTIPYLTTNYADMYVGDLIDYGTTELIGIKSIDVEYQKSCVPIITIKFTDVRGLSLFQPTELSRGTTFEGIKGLNSDNVAQSFFQCFFRVPMPKFTITIKGYYGKPVTYEVMCDKFDTQFNSETGDFDITARFIGYSYSFLTDISIDALIAAPYSDYIGQQYWEREIQNRFQLKGKDGTLKPMPTLVEVYLEIRKILKEDTNVIETALTDEEATHTNEIATLQDIKLKYQAWFLTLYKICCKRYGKKYCYLFQDDTKKDEYNRILILTTSATNMIHDLSGEYETLPKEFKKIHNDLYTAIEKYNARENSTYQIKNISKDFSQYLRLNIFNNLFINGQGEIVFNGFNKNCSLPQTEIIQEIFNGVDYESETTEETEVQGKRVQHHNFVLSTIYNDGVNQYVDGFNIFQDYSFIQRRIDELQLDANKSTEEQTHEKRIKELNNQILQSMKWYPSVENFTKIMMAHLETLMAMMYQVVSNSEGRTAAQLGVTVGPDGNCCDVASNDNVVPPFPRVTKHVIGDDGIIKHEDTWVGEYNNGEKGFEEVDLIDGLFNGVEKFMAKIKDSDTVLSEKERNSSASTSTTDSSTFAVKYPLSSLDFFITKSPYGDANDISNDKLGYQFAGKVAIRMFDILAINNFRNDFGTSYILNTKTLQMLGSVEAENFYNSVRISNEQFLSLIRSNIFETSLLNIITSQNHDENCPWGERRLFSKSEDNLWLQGYPINNSNSIYPIQDINFANLDVALNAWKQGTITSKQNTIAVWNLPNVKDEKALYKAKLGNYGLGNVILYDDYTAITTYIENANTDTGNTYASFHSKISEASKFDASAYESYIKVNNKNMPPSICQLISLTNSAATFTVDANSKLVHVGNSVYNIALTVGFGDEAEQGNITNFTITEAFGINGNCSLNMNGSFQQQSPNILPRNFNQAQGMTLCGLFCININYEPLLSLNNKTFAYMPKLIVLQIGALAMLGGGINNFSANAKTIKKIAISNGLPLYGTTHFDILLNYVAKMSKPARLEYIQYLYKWMNNSPVGRKFAYFITNPKNLLYPSNSNILRRVFNQNSSEIKLLTNDLLKPVLSLKLSVNYLYNQSKNSYRYSKTQALVYITSFLDKLKQLYQIGYTKSEEGNVVKIAETPQKTTNDMKKELYRYMKQVYDKWIPMSSFKDWQLESFFIDEDGGEEQGHKFYFIDSYYNSIGKKLLINPQILSEKLDALFQYRDINAMMLGFMADIYSANKCMLMCIQNFADLKKPHAMDETFVPLSFNSIDWKNLNKFSSFVIVYPYEPSKFLNIPNSEYNNDSFMLNNENETPIAIRSKTDKEGQYLIPAFGVTYGKQYQSFFKSVNVNMQSPIATQQSIQAKHYILQSNGSAKEKGVVAQDLYDIYSTQSYTCEVEMMGCAWIQPLMYFVLLNIPMFNGSYMIFKVRHSIRPGDMTTTFSGCRMANVSNKIIEDIFTDDGSLGNNYTSSLTTLKEKKASVDNDCPYKEFPLYEENLSGAQWNGDEKGPTFTSNKAWAQSMFHAYLSAGASIYIAKVIVAQDANECGWGKSQIERFNMGGIKCHDGQNNPSGYQSYNSIAEYVYDKKSILQRNYPGTWEATSWNDYFDILLNINGKNPKEMRYAEDAGYKTKIMGKDGNGGTYKLVNEYLKDVSTVPSNADQLSSSKSKNVNEALFNALQKTSNATPSLSINLKYQEINGYGVITQDNGKTDKLGTLFDMILSTYDQYIQKIYWVYPSNGLSSEPVHIDYIATSAPKVAEKQVRVAQSSNIKATESYEIPADANEQLLKSLSKLRLSINADKTFLKEVPQIRDISILDKFKPKDCDSLFASNIGGGNFYIPTVIHQGGCTDTSKPPISTAVKYLNDNTGYNFKEQCWKYVKDALVKGGLPDNSIIPAADASPYLEKNGYKCIYAGYNEGHKGTNYGQPCLGDITVFEKTAGHPYGHIAMWCGNNWISDFKQNGNWVSNSYRGRFTVWRYLP